MEASPGTYPLLLQDEVFTYDVVNNPIEIRDNRIAEEWPAGAKPVSKRIEYDDLYRASKIDYRYAAGDDTWKSPFEAELAAGDGAGDSRRAKPSPHVSFAKRILWQSYQYDWLGNTRLTGDDAKGFYDRSLGTIDNGTANAGPYQLLSASNVGAGTAPDGVNRTGALDATYDDCGNLTTLELDRAGPCLGAGTCGQSFVYSWDEVGRLVRARRFDQPSLPADVNAATPAVDLQYHYASGDSRVLKTASDPTTGAQVHTAYVFPSLELRRAEFDTDAPGDYTLDSTTEVGYLFANGVRLARLVHEPLDSAGDGVLLRVFFELGDHLGSTSVALDKATGELVERSTYQAYGGAESSYRPDKWGNFREDYGFTGKEEDVEVGLTYFGKRFYNALLQRWVSADPLEVHVGGADPNLYAYVSGRALQNVDPLGLDGEPVQTDRQKVDASVNEALNDQGGGAVCGMNMSCEAEPWEVSVANSSNFVNRAQPGDLDPPKRADAKPPEQVTDAENWKRAVQNEVVSESVAWVQVAALAILGGEGASDVLEAGEAAEEKLGHEMGESPNKGLITATVAVGAVLLPGPGAEYRESREVLEQFSTFNAARRNAQEMSRIGDDAVNFVSEMGPAKGFVVGRQSSDGLRGWRVDFDPGDANKGFHVNWWDRTGGAKRVDWKYGANTVPGKTQNDFWDLVNHFGRE